MHTKSTFSVNGVKVPSFFYGTAWKEERTQSLVEQAIERGFRGFDTANQRRHYYEAAVGQAIAGAIAKGFVTRDELFLQTKFTFRRGQDHRLPYDPNAPISRQVEQSFASSLEHLGVERLDSYVLHAPTSSNGLTGDDWAAWWTMEQLHDRSQVRLLGVSNVTVEQLDLLCTEARIQPSFVQNRCFAALGWDRHVRQLCAEHGIVYQGFSLLTANQQVFNTKELGQIASRHDRTVPQIVFRFAIEVGMIPLTGTTNPQHMSADLEVLKFSLEDEEIELIEQVGAIT